MPSSLGAIELLLLATSAIPCMLLYVRRHRHHRLVFALLACASLAALFTPADVVSMMLLFIAFVGVFMYGLRIRMDPTATAT